VKLTGKINKAFLYLWAASILWIYIGSLVNFHQHKIWGRPLLTQLLYAKRDKEQSVDFKKLLDPGSPKVITPDQSTIAGILQPGQRIALHATFPVIYSLSVEFFPVKEFILPSGLRAPPLS